MKGCKFLILLLALMLTNFYGTSENVPKYRLDTRIAHAIKTGAIDIRKSKLALFSIVTFDGEKDKNGNEIFRVDLTINPFSIYEEEDYLGYARVYNAIVLIKDTEYALDHMKKVKCIEDWMCIYNVTNNGINVYNTTPPERYYFVITDDEVLPYLPEAQTE